MCVEITQMVGYLVPAKKVALLKLDGKEREKIFSRLNMNGLSNGHTCVFVVYEQTSECECGDSNGDGREFSRNTFNTLIMDEDDEKMNDIEAKKNKLTKDLEDIGLLKYATWGLVTDAYADPH